jgi:hypothetical protein
VRAEKPLECQQHWFLLDRSKASILSRFEVTVISLYFPEFKRELPR